MIISGKIKTSVRLIGKDLLWLKAWICYHIKLSNNKEIMIDNFNSSKYFNLPL